MTWPRAQAILAALWALCEAGTITYAEWETQGRIVVAGLEREP